MTDRKPPRLASGERETLMALLQYQRDSLVRKVEDLDIAAASQRLVPSDTTLVWLVRHLARAEALWVLSRFLDDPGAAVEAPPEDSDSIASALADYRSTCSRVDQVVAEHELDEIAADGTQPRVNLRWILMHLLEETARHAGHADILRELYDGSTGR